MTLLARQLSLVRRCAANRRFDHIQFGDPSSLRQPDPRFGYDLATVQVLSDSINAERGGYDEQQTIKIGNLYGAFLGKAILALCATLNGRWIRSNDSIGIQFQRGGQVRIAFPLTRVFKQIEQGEAASIFDFLASIKEFATANPA